MRWFKKSVTEVMNVRMCVLEKGTKRFYFARNYSVEGSAYNQRNLHFAPMYFDSSTFDVSFQFTIEQDFNHTNALSPPEATEMIHADLARLKQKYNVESHEFENSPHAKLYKTMMLLFESHIGSVNLGSCVQIGIKFRGFQISRSSDCIEMECRGERFHLDNNLVARDFTARFDRMTKAKDVLSLKLAQESVEEELRGF